jgi:LmbE family N-acetylglucosaminyl deacetylase
MSQKAVHLMVISPHPHDPEWAISGTAARFIREGKEVVYVICADGRSMGTLDPNMKLEELVKIREREQIDAAKVVGVKEVVLLRHPDMSLENTADFRRELVRQIRKFRPQIVATFDPFYRIELNLDHRITAVATVDAVWPSACAPHVFPELLEEGLQPHMVQEVWLWGSMQTNYHVDISEVWDIKMKAFRVPKSQVGDPLEPEIARQIVEAGKRAAKGESYEYGEAFNRLVKSPTTWAVTLSP